MKFPTANWSCFGLAIILHVASAASAHDGKHAAAPASPMTSADAPIPGTPTATITAFHAALTRGDTKAALSFLAEDVLVFESGHVEASRAEYEAHHLAADAEFSASVQRKLLDRRVVENGENAYVTTSEKVTGTFRQRPINSRSLETITLRRANGQWRITHIHWSSANLKAD